MIYCCSRPNIGRQVEIKQSTEAIHHLILGKRAFRWDALFKQLLQAGYSNHRLLSWQQEYFSI
jgi:hypothetical protein